MAQIVIEPGLHKLYGQILEHWDSKLEEAYVRNPSLYYWPGPGDTRQMNYFWERIEAGMELSFSNRAVCCHHHEDAGFSNA